MSLLRLMQYIRSIAMLSDPTAVLVAASGSGPACCLLLVPHISKRPLIVLHVCCTKNNIA